MFITGIIAPDGDRERNDLLSRECTKWEDGALDSVQICEKNTSKQKLRGPKADFTVTNERSYKPVKESTKKGIKSYVRAVARNLKLLARG